MNQPLLPLNNRHQCDGTKQSINRNEIESPNSREFGGRFGVTLGSLWGHFGVTLESLWGHLGIWGSLWIHFGPFSKYTHFLIDSNDFIKLWDYLGVALGSLWGHFGVALGPVWDRGAFRGHFGVTLSMSTSNFMCDACLMHTCTGLVGPKTGKAKKRIGF